jgi:ABC-type sugar transport system ATPase subunit
MLLEMHQISKNFDAVAALKNVDFYLEEGEIHGLMGENGAGKSTLMNILGGVFQPTSGEIYLDGSLVQNLDEKRSRELGIRFIHQELNLVNDLSIQENLFLGEEITNRFGILDRKLIREKSLEVLAKVNLPISPSKLVGEVDTSVKQLVEIAKALLFKCKIIIMDEPTTALSDEEISHLFQIMRSLKSHGASIIYISHKMPEIFEICGKFTVLRDGNLIDTGLIKDINVSRATELLVGQHLSDNIAKFNNAGETILQAEKLCCDGYFSNISFELKKGEVLVFTGLQGDGRGELAECLFGARQLSSGTVKINGKELPLSSIKKVMQTGIGMVQRNRKERSIIKDLSISDNIIMAKHVVEENRRFVDYKAQNALFADYKNRLNLKAPSGEKNISELSGGNQQKVIIARWLALGASIYILDNPTQGIDVGSKFEIYKLINDLAMQNTSVILFTSEFPEIQKVGDRCIVMYKGSINASLPRSDFDEKTIMFYSTGSNLQKVM